MDWVKQGAALALLSVSAPSALAQWNHALGSEIWAFSESGEAGQDNTILAASYAPEYRDEWNGGDDRFTFEGFVRLDSEDSRRTHGDIRSLFWHRLGPNWDLRAGVDRVFWGVTEFDNPADVVNQTDLVEDPDGDERLGQPMIRFTYLADFGTWDFLALPGFRERTFAGEDGRFRTTPPVSANDAEYESGAEQHRMDAAIRFRFLWQQTDWALMHFSGTSRDPVLKGELQNGQPALVPRYEVIDHSALTVQSARGSWLWKAELVSRSGPIRRHTQATGGFEVTSYNWLGSGWDMGWIAEYLFDDRKDNLEVPFERDWFWGARLQLNDIQSSELLFGLVYDPATSERVYSLEASTRIGSSLTLDIESRIFSGGDGIDRNNPTISTGNKLGFLQQDDYIRTRLRWFF